MSQPPTVTAPHSHIEISPRILYPGTPVALVSTINPDGNPNLAPMSSFWALGWTAMLGFGRHGQTAGNLRRTGECVINFPGPELWPAVERLAPLTGKNPPPEHVRAYGGRFEPDKFAAAGLTPVESIAVAAPRVLECRLQLEARLVALRVLEDEPGCVAAEVRVLRVHAAPEMLRENHHIDPGNWRPLLYNFRRYFGLGTALGSSFRDETRSP